MAEQETFSGKINQIGRWLFGVRRPPLLHFEADAVQLGLPELMGLALELGQPEKLFLFRPISTPDLPELNRVLLARPDTHTITQTELDLPLPPELPLQISLLLDIPGRYQFATNVLLDSPRLYAPPFQPPAPAVNDLSQKALANWPKSSAVDLIQLLMGQEDPALKPPQPYPLAEQPWLTLVELETVPFQPEPLAPEDLTTSSLQAWPKEETENVFYLLTGRAEAELDLPEQRVEQAWELQPEAVLESNLQFSKPLLNDLTNLELQNWSALDPLDLIHLLAGVDDPALARPAQSDLSDTLCFSPHPPIEAADLAIPAPEVTNVAADDLLHSATLEIMDLFQFLLAGKVLGKNYEADRVITTFKGKPSPQKRPIEDEICIHGLLKSTCDICSKPINTKRKSSGPAVPAVANVFELLLPYLQPPIDAITDWSSIFPPGKHLYNFQVSGSHFLVTNPSALLADEMGLGKSVQAIFALRILFRRTKKPITTLISCPKSVLKDWEKKLHEWAPELRVTTIEGLPRLRHNLWQTPTHVHLASYDTLASDIDNLEKTHYDVVILDEVQAIKSASTKRTKAVRKLEAEWRWGLSATPLENHPDDLVSIFHFLKPGLLTYEDGQNRTRLKNKIKPHMLRRRIQDVQDEINLKEPITAETWLELTPEQRQRYNDVLDKARKALRPLTHDSGSGPGGRTDFEVKRKILAEITELKKICNFDPVTGKSCKADYLQEKLLDIEEVNEKSLIFSQYPNISLQPLAQALKKFKPDLFDGSLSNTRRDEKIQEFQESSTTNVLLMSVKAGGVGITLTRANHVFFLDQWWNPATGKQAIGRAYRIGQKKTVYVTILYAVNTIEERIRAILERKQQLFDEIVDDQSDKIYEKITVEELFEILGMVQFDVVLQDPGRAIGRTIQRISELSGLNDYQKTRQLLQKLPAMVMENVSREQAEEIKLQLEETSGAKVAIRSKYS